MKIKSLFLILTVSSLASSTWAEVAPVGIFSDHAVLQQGVPIPVWGRAKEGERVSVSFDGQTETTFAKDGKWMVRLKAHAAGGPFVMTIAGENSLTIRDVLVGEVWMCGGQSNMNNGFGSAANAATEGPLANYPQMREFHVTFRSAIRPVADLGYDEKRGGHWVVCSPKDVGTFGAVSYFFGRDVHKATGAPVGLIRAAIGGTAAQCWTSLDGLKKEPTLSGYVDQYEKEVPSYDEEAAKYPQAMADFQTKYKEWFNTVGKTHQDAVKAVDEKNKKNDAEGKPRIPRPAPPVPQPKQPRAPGGGANTPALLFNGMIAPVIPYAIKGTIWYQGEANSGKGFEYRTLFPRLISDWREKWGLGETPFLFVQITPHNTIAPEIREAQFLTSQTVPNTAMAVTVDVGMANDIHSPLKEPVGVRLALAARALAYGEKIEYSGPVYNAFSIEQNKIVLRFTHVGGGLVAKGGALKGFVIAGADKKFVEAKTEIVGDTVVVSNEQVASPVAVRYGWANVPDVNLWNKDGLPASPFRTDPEAISQSVKK